MGRTSHIRRTSGRAKGEPKEKKEAVALAPVDATDSNLSMRQRNNALKRYYSTCLRRDPETGQMRPWTLEEYIDFRATLPALMQFVDNQIIQAHKNGIGPAYYHAQMVDGHAVSGLFVDERGTSIETVNPARAGEAFAAYLRLWTEERQAELLTMLWEVLRPAQRNKLCLQSEKSASKSKKAAEPLLLDFWQWAQRKFNDDGDLLILHTTDPKWGIRQSPPDSEIVAETEYEEDENDE